MLQTPLQKTFTMVLSWMKRTKLVSVVGIPSSVVDITSQMFVWPFSEQRRTCDIHQAFHQGKSGRVRR
jgi:hypothetical protein